MKEDVMTALAPGKIPVALKDVERELSMQITLLHGPREEPIQRARMANLVIYCTSQAQADVINADLTEIMNFHPARVILLIADPSGDDQEIKAFLTIRPINVGRSEMTFGEQITLEAGGALGDRLPFAVRSLLIGDLPTNLWWVAPEPPALAGQLLFELAEGAQQIMYDSLGWPDPTRGVAATGRWLAQVERVGPGNQWRVVSDLNWRRLKYWRRILVQSLAPASAPGVAASASEILVEHGPHAVVQAWELASWATLRLGWQVQAGRVQPGAEMVWRFTPEAKTAGSPTEGRVRLRRLEKGPPEIRHVRIACRLGDVNGAINLAVENEVRLAVTLEGLDAAPRTVTVPPHSASELIGRQLSDRENSPAFRDSMAVAQTMAQSLLH
jgi:glucose-6-phosphate dehydrogenase assembly protein OpcA